MNSYTTEVDKLEQELRHLRHLLASDHVDEDGIQLTLSVAKRVRRQSTLVVRAIARHQEQLQPKEGTSV